MGLKGQDTYLSWAGPRRLPVAPAQPSSSSLFLHPLPSLSEALTHKPKKIYSMLAPPSACWLPNKVMHLKVVFHSTVAAYFLCYNTGMLKSCQKVSAFDRYFQSLNLGYKLENVENTTQLWLKFYLNLVFHILPKSKRDGMNLIKSQIFSGEICRFFK